MAKKSIEVPIRLGIKEPDLRIRTYSQIRSEHGYRGNDYLQGLLAMAMNGKPLPVIAKIHSRRELTGYDIRKFRIKGNNPCYETLITYPSDFLSYLIRHTLDTCILEAEPGEPEWFMSETALRALAVDIQLDCVIKPEIITAETVQQKPAEVMREELPAKPEEKETQPVPAEKTESIKKKKKGVKLTVGMIGYE